MMKTEISTAALSSTISAGNKTMLGGAAGSFGGWLLSINWMSAAGLFVTLAGFAVSLYFSILKNRREERQAIEASIINAQKEERERIEHEARLRILESQYKSFTPKDCAAANIRQDDYYLVLPDLQKSQGAQNE